MGWYGSAYLVTASALQPTYGRIFTLFDIKWSFLGAMATFEIGSLICGVAPNSVVLIIGRAIAGFGSAGIVTGSFVVVAHSVPLVKRPVYTGMVGVMCAESICYMRGLLTRYTGSALELSLDLYSVVFLRIV